MSRAFPLFLDDAGAGVCGSTAQFRGRFHFWRGRSGQRTVFSVFPISAVPEFSQVVAVAVRTSGSRREVLWIGEIGETGDLSSTAGMQMAIACGANELHIHLIASSPAQRRALLEDLTGRERLPHPVAPPWRQRQAA